MPELASGPGSGRGISVIFGKMLQEQAGKTYPFEVRAGCQQQWNTSGDPRPPVLVTVVITGVIAAPNEIPATTMSVATVLCIRFMRSPAIEKSGSMWKVKDH
jgi:hypothetical protein